ncbi:MAG: DUF1569 domain-containing protein [Ferruginibacter sp.]
METLFDKHTYDLVIGRLEKLSPAATAKWGKMNVAQMLAHCKEAFKVPLTEKKIPRMMIGRLMGWMIKSKLHDDSTWKPGLPTAPAFIIKNERNFNDEKKGLTELVNKFFQLGPNGISKHPHPMFGRFTEEQWGKAMYKHLDHHLRQFGA